MLPVTKGISTLNRHKNKGFFLQGWWWWRRWGWEFGGKEPSWFLWDHGLCWLQTWHPWGGLPFPLAWYWQPGYANNVNLQANGLGLDIWQILLKTYGTPGFLGHAGEIALNPIHNGCGHVFFLLVFFRNENDFTLYDNRIHIIQKIQILQKI